MPELPEVETVRRVLEKWILNKTIVDVIFHYKAVLDGISANEFKEKIINQKIKKIDRQAKFLLFELSDYILISHLRMEGKYYLINSPKLDEKVKKHRIVSFQLDDGNTLIYHDVRKFGKMKLITYKEKSTDPSLLRLAKEPYTIDEETLYKKISASSRKIKTLLLDQKIIAGLGNIYVDEVLFAAKINPLKEGKNITKKEIAKIIKYSIEILNKSIELGGASVYSYAYEGNVSGKFQNQLKVYARKDLPCYVCQNKIEKIQINGRGTHYCKKCQK